ncbi:response regulator [Curvivirga aplysinae]|uniref:response regulator n=1 Tax=Curvivirga aplysinae TaxID=2529852 RepID=UPI001C3F91C2|nr:response regulator [Curvivirga aplysinae]
MVQMAVPNQKIIKATSMFFDPNRDSGPIGRAALQSAGLTNTQFHLDIDMAMSYLSMHTPELLVVDLAPDTKEDGLMLIAAARSKKDDNPPRVLGLLAGGTREALVEAIKGGVDTVIVKPLAPDSLHKKIKSLMASPQNYISAKGYYGPDRRRVPDAEEFTGEERRSN